MSFFFCIITLGLQKALQGKLGRPSIHAWSAPRFMGDSSSIHDHCCSACRQAGQILDSCPACPSIHGLCTGLPVPRFMPGLPLDSWPASWADPRFMDSALSYLCLNSLLFFPRFMAALVCSALTLSRQELLWAQNASTQVGIKISSDGN